MDIVSYWKGVNEILDTLPKGDAILVASLDNVERGSTAGQTTIVPRKLAAELIFKKTHRLATEKDRATHNERESVESDRIMREEYARKQQFALPDELNSLVKLAIAGAATNKKAGE